MLTLPITIHSHYNAHYKMGIILVIITHKVDSK